MTTLCCECPYKKQGCHNTCALLLHRIYEYVSDPNMEVSTLVATSPLISLSLLSHYHPNAASDGFLMFVRSSKCKV